MAKYGITNIAGGGGVGSDEISVSKEYVLNGKTYVGSDTDDEIGTGSMANNGTTANQSLNAGGSFSVKKGYHAQNFAVIANSLASQTSGTAIPSHVLNGETYWTNGNKLTGTMNLQSILSFSCAPYSASQIIFTWQNPYVGPFSGVIIIGKTGGYPTNLNDGTRYYKGFGNNTNGGGLSNAVIGGFAINITYYFTVFSYTTVNGEEWLSGNTKTTTSIIHQITQVFTDSTIWTVPNGINNVQVFCVGGGGGGYAPSAMYTGDCAGFGGGGGYTTTQTISVTAGQQITVSIGAKGIYDGGNGGQTSFGTVTAQGGFGGRDWASGTVMYSRGGSGGGAAGRRTKAWKLTPYSGAGGADGANGNSSYEVHDDNGFMGYINAGGNGQGSTTRAFGESWNTLYAGGGGGGCGMKPDSQSASTNPGGSGGGGQGGGGQGGGYNSQDISNATPNTGGGGGGAGGRTNSAKRYPGNGGSGICIIRYIQ